MGQSRERQDGRTPPLSPIRDNHVHTVVAKEDRGKTHGDMETPMHKCTNAPMAMYDIPRLQALPLHQCTIAHNSSQLKGWQFTLCKFKCLYNKKK